MFPYYDFNQSGIDYAAVEVTITQMYSYLLHKGSPCCKPKNIEKVLIESNYIMYGAAIDKASGDTARYEADLQAAYGLLYPQTPR